MEDYEKGTVTIPLSQNDEETIAKCLHKIVERLRSRRLTIRRLFNGITADSIPQADFASRLSFVEEIVTNDIMILMVKKYKVSSNGEIDWKTFVRDVESSSLLL